MIKRLFLLLLLVALLVVGYFWLVLKWSYSTGERAGYVQKFSKKGWVCKTWEGELALLTLPGGATEKFYFTVNDDRVAQEIKQAMGTRVALHYEEKVGLPTSCFGDTRYFVTKAVGSADNPLGNATPAGVAPAPPTTPAPASAVK